MKPLVFFLLMLTLPAQAFIPPSDYLVGKVVKNHGRGYFVIEQDVTFKNESETLTLREKWTIQDAENMRLTVTGGSVALNILIQSGKVYYTNNGTSISSRKISPESFERFFHARTDKTLTEYLMSSKVLSQSPLRNRVRPRAVSQIKPEIDPYVRLVRVDETPTLLISSTPNPADSGSSPGLWVDQNNFTIKKIRFPSGAEVVASQYQSLSQELVYARTKTVNYDNNTIEIRLVKANSIAKTKDTEALFSSGTLLGTTSSWGQSSLSSQVQDFYQRFR